VWGRHYSNPIGLAAGFDKHAEAYLGMLAMGFGFVEIGSVTPRPQGGNPRPRVFRLPKDQAVINRYGFNSHGHAVVRARLASWPSRRHKYPGKQLGVSLGKNKESLQPTEDYVQGIRVMGEFADYIAINVSSPNTPGLRDMQARDQLACLLDAVIAERDSLPGDHRPPLVVKISPDLTPAEREDIAACVCRPHPHRNPDGLVITNTTMSRPESLRSEHKNESGGLSGQPIREMSTEAIRDMYRLTGALRMQQQW
jgi:dihydroorotate dehydrogenase